MAKNQRNIRPRLTGNISFLSSPAQIYSGRSRISVPQVSGGGRYRAPSMRFVPLEPPSDDVYKATAEAGLKIMDAAIKFVDDVHTYDAQELELKYAHSLEDLKTRVPFKEDGTPFMALTGAEAVKAKDELFRRAQVLKEGLLKEYNESVISKAKDSIATLDLQFKSQIGTFVAKNHRIMLDQMQERKEGEFERKILTASDKPEVSMQMFDIQGPTVWPDPAEREYQRSEYSMKMIFHEADQGKPVTQLIEEYGKYTRLHPGQVQEAEALSAARQREQKRNDEFDYTNDLNTYKRGQVERLMESDDPVEWKKIYAEHGESRWGKTFSLEDAHRKQMDETDGMVYEPWSPEFNAVYDRLQAANTKEAANEIIDEAIESYFNPVPGVPRPDKASLKAFTAYRNNPTSAMSKYNANMKEASKYLMNLVAQKVPTVMGGAYGDTPKPAYSNFQTRTLGAYLVRAYKPYLEKTITEDKDSVFDFIEMLPSMFVDPDSVGGKMMLPVSGLVSYTAQTKTPLEIQDRLGYLLANPGEGSDKEISDYQLMANIQEVLNPGVVETQDRGRELQGAFRLTGAEPPASEDVLTEEEQPEVDVGPLMVQKTLDMFGFNRDPYAEAPMNYVSRAMAPVENFQVPEFGQKETRLFNVLDSDQGAEARLSAFTALSKLGNNPTHAAIMDALDTSSLTMAERQSFAAIFSSAGEHFIGSDESYSDEDLDATFKHVMNGLAAANEIVKKSSASEAKKDATIKILYDLGVDVVKHRDEKRLGYQAEGRKIDNKKQADVFRRAVKKLREVAKQYE